MSRVLKVIGPLRDAATYRALAFLLIGLPLGIAWFVMLVVGWSVGVSLVVVLLIGIPILLVLDYACRGAAALEHQLANSLLRADIASPGHPPRTGRLWQRLRIWLTDPISWREQAYLMTRFVVGLPAACLALSTAVWSLGHLTAPAWYWTLPSREDQYTLGFGAWWRVDSLGEAFLAIPLGAVGLIVTGYLVRGLAIIWRAVAQGLLGGARTQTADDSAATAAPRGRRAWRGLAVLVHGAGAIAVCALVIIIWLLSTPSGYFWPIWVILPLALIFAIHLTCERLGQAHLHRRTLWIHLAIWAELWLFLVSAWAATTFGDYFWPMWVLVPMGLIVGAHAAWPQAAARARIDELTSTRAGVVDVQASELRRIERDLHDGAQARLVALNMNLGMAEQKLDSDPTAARQLVEEARADVRTALTELRDLARGIHPPVLADRGLEAAVASLVSTTAVPTTLEVDVPRRPEPAIESATYFMVAESLTNAAKHSGATRIEVRIVVRGGRLVVEVDDDGVGGANASGSGLVGLRRRLEALDGRLYVESPPGGGTRVRAELPCAS